MFNMSENIKNISRKKFSHKKIIYWEPVLLALTNIAIFLNLFIYLDGFFAEYIGNFIDSKSYYDPSVETHISTSMALSVLMIPLFIIIKYLSLPITIWIIKKFSRKEEIINWIEIIIEKHKFKTLFAVILLDAIVCLVNFILYEKTRNYLYNDNIFWYLIFGGLTGSYLVLFLFGFIFKRLKGFSLLKNR